MRDPVSIKTTLKNGSGKALSYEVSLRPVCDYYNINDPTLPGWGQSGGYFSGAMSEDQKNALRDVQSLQLKELQKHFVDTEAEISNWTPAGSQESLGL